MISITAAIGSAHAASGIKTMMENELISQMTTICRMLTMILDTHSLPTNVDVIAGFASWVGVDEIYITDGDGVTVGSNIAGAIGWRFPDDPKAQAYEYRGLIKQTGGVVTQPIAMRDIDKATFKFVGVSRTDESGKVQVGYKAESSTRHPGEIGSVFGALAEAISSLW
jgi:methyl-accepting chemotaxis protein